MNYDEAKNRVEEFVRVANSYLPIVTDANFSFAVSEIDRSDGLLSLSIRFDYDGESVDGESMVYSLTQEIADILGNCEYTGDDFGDDPKSPYCMLYIE